MAGTATKEKHHYTGLSTWLLAGCHRPNPITSELSPEIPQSFYFHIYIILIFLIIFFPPNLAQAIPEKQLMTTLTLSWQRPASAQAEDLGLRRTGTDLSAGGNEKRASVLWPRGEIPARPKAAAKLPAAPRGVWDLTCGFATLSIARSRRSGRRCFSLALLSRGGRFSSAVSFTP